MKGKISTLMTVILQLSASLKATGVNLIRVAIFIIFIWIGGLKFWNYEAEGIVPLYLHILQRIGLNDYVIRNPDLIGHLLAQAGLHRGRSCHLNDFRNTVVSHHHSRGLGARFGQWRARIPAFNGCRKARNQRHCDIGRRHRCTG